MVTEIQEQERVEGKSLLEGAVTHQRRNHLMVFLRKAGLESFALKDSEAVESGSVSDATYKPPTKDAEWY